MSSPSPLRPLSPLKQGLTALGAVVAVSVALAVVIGLVPGMSPTAQAATAASTGLAAPAKRAAKPLQLGYPNTAAKRKAQRKAVRALAACKARAAKQHSKAAERRVRKRCAQLPRPYVWTPDDSTKFNYPFATKAERERIRRQILHAIDYSPAGSKIRLASFAFVDPVMTKALIRAYRRGVSIQMLLDRKMIDISPPYYKLKKVIGTRVPTAAVPAKRLRGLTKAQKRRVIRRHAAWAAKALQTHSFIRICKKSCRGTSGELHSKFYLFSRVGRAKYVTMLGSANLATRAFKGQWNDMATIVGRGTYRQFGKLFREMRTDRPRKSPFYGFSTKDVRAWVFPKPGTTRATDPTVQILRSINCQAAPSTGRAVPRATLKRYAKLAKRNAAHNRKVQARAMHRLSRQLTRAKRVQAKATTAKARKKARASVARIMSRMRAAAKPRATLKPWQRVTRRSIVRISMYAWFDKRGNYISQEVRRLWNRGCDVKVVYSVSNPTVVRTLTKKSGRGRIPTRKLVLDGVYGTPLKYNHTKYVALDGRASGRPARFVWTGSMNFTSLGLRNDDIIVRLSGPAVIRSYLANFKRIYRDKRTVRP